MLDDLKGVLDEINKTNDWEHHFVCNLIIKKEEDPTYKLSGKQFEVLTRIHRKYI